MRHIGTLAKLTAVALFSSLLFTVPSHYCIAFLLGTIIFLASRRSYNRESNRMICACAAVCLVVLFYDPEPASETSADIMSVSRQDGGKISVDRATGEVFLTTSVQRLRRIREERYKLRQEDPEEWRRQIHARKKQREAGEITLE